MDETSHDVTVCAGQMGPVSVELGNSNPRPSHGEAVSRPIDHLTAEVLGVTSPGAPWGHPRWAEFEAVIALGGFPGCTPARARGVLSVTSGQGWSANGSNPSLPSIQSKFVQVAS